jgi:hypothetical protein
MYPPMNNLEPEITSLMASALTSRANIQEKCTTNVAEKGQPKPCPVFRDLQSPYPTTTNPASTTTRAPHITNDARLQFKLDTSSR